MLLFNDVLNKGFDGSHFITGLSSHFRDLLVSKDAATLALLEVGAGIRQRYQEQAKKCALPFLYRAMKLCNDCDINYRASKNKRLLVELAIIQVAQLTAEGEDVNGGRSPEQTIKPIFTQPAVAQQPQAAPVVARTQPTVAPVAPTVPTASPIAPKVAPAPAVSQTGNNNAVPPVPQAVLMAQNKEEKKIPVMNKASMGLSIKHPQKETTQQNTSAGVQLPNQAQPIEEDFIFNEKDLNYYWHEYAGQLSVEQKAIAMRMQNMKVTLLNESTFEAVVDNEIVAKDFTVLIPELQNYLRSRLRNRTVKMKVRVSAPTENVRAFSRVEKFQMMAQKNSALMQLKEEFGLELY